LTHGSVIVAGLITSADDSPVAIFLDGMLNARIRFVMSNTLLAEYGEALARQKLRPLHKLSDAQIETVLVEIARNAIFLNPSGAAVMAPDPGDQFLCDLLASNDDLVPITGDHRLLNDVQMKSRVLTPREYIDTVADG